MVHLPIEEALKMAADALAAEQQLSRAFSQLTLIVHTRQLDTMKFEDPEISTFCDTIAVTLSLKKTISTRWMYQDGSHGMLRARKGIHGDICFEILRKPTSEELDVVGSIRIFCKIGRKTDELDDRT